MYILLRTTFRVASLRRIFYGLRDLLTSAQGQAPPGEPQPSCPAHAEFVICDCTIELVQQAVYEFAIVALPERPALMERLLADLRSGLVPARRLRFNARVVKRPLSRFRRKRYWHLQGPHLKGVSFREILRI
jgi:hypothetical protein